MNQAIDKILAQVRPKVAAILRTRKYYKTAELIDQFKTHIWGLMEFQDDAIFHASDYLLSELDQVKFVQAMTTTAQYFQARSSLESKCHMNIPSIAGMHALPSPESQFDFQIVDFGEAPVPFRGQFGRLGSLCVPWDP